MALKLYGNLTCPFVQRTRIVAVEKNIPMHYIDVPLGKDQPTWFRRLNPAGTVPTLNVAGGCLTQSMAIAEYLDASFPAPHDMFPPMATIRAQIREFVRHVDRFAVVGLRALGDPDFATARPEFEAATMRLENAMADRSQGPFFLGTKFSLADVALVPFLDRFRHGFPAFCNFEPFTATPRLRFLLGETDNRMSIIETRLTRVETLRSLEATVGRKCNVANPVVRVGRESVVDARIWVAAHMANIPVDLRAVVDPQLPRLSVNTRDVYDATNAMMMILEMGDAFALIPESNFETAKAHCIIADADALVLMLDPWAGSGETPPYETLNEAIAMLKRLVIGPYVFGAQPCFADAVVAPIVHLVNRYIGLHNTATAAGQPSVFISPPLALPEQLTHLQALYLSAKQCESFQNALSKRSPSHRW